MQNLLRIASQLNLHDRSPTELLCQYAAILQELQSRGISRTSNNPVADYAEWLVSQKLDLKLKGNSSAGYDAEGPDSARYEIKSRRATSKSISYQLSAIRNLEAHHFDFVIAVLFELDFTVSLAFKIPDAVVLEKSTFQPHTNSHVFRLKRSLLEDERVEEITAIFNR